MVKKKPVEEKAVEPEVSLSDQLTIDGETYKLYADFNTLADYEAMTGANLLHAIPALLTNTLSANQLRGLLFAACQKNHPTVTLLKAGQMVRIDTMPDIYLALAGSGLIATKAE